MKDIKACVFDAYGTLFDVHSAVGALTQEIAAHGDPQALSATWRQKQIEYTWLRSLMGAHIDFWQVTGDGLDYAIEKHRIQAPDLRQKLMEAYLRLETYPEVPATLRDLKSLGFKLAILSNGAPIMLEAAVENAGLTDLFDAVLSIEDAGIFKPDRQTYQLACNRFDIEPPEVCFLSSNAWDVCGSAHFGFQVVWINRFDQPPERLPGDRRATIKRLADLPPLLDATNRP
ncbi:MAG: haloacid dehalogenase type II [Geminicoccaceae bacterium]